MKRRPAQASGKAVARLLLAMVVALWLAVAGSGQAALAQATPESPPRLSPQTPQNPQSPPAEGAECSCTGDLYSCESFSLWSAAQACFNRCRIAVGFDIHGLDEDGDGIACELPLPTALLSETLTATIPSLESNAMLTGTDSVTATGEVTAMESVTGAASVSPTESLSPTEVLTASAPASQPIESPKPTPAQESAAVRAPDPSAPIAAAEPGTVPIPRAVILLVVVSSMMLLVVLGVLIWLLRRQMSRDPSRRSAEKNEA